MDDYLSKPLEAATLLAKLANLALPPKPQLPMTIVVTPKAGEGEAVLSHVSCAS